MYRNSRIEFIENEHRDAFGNLMIDGGDRWVNLAREIPWKLFEDQFAANFVTDLLRGTPAQQVRMLLGALIIQEVYALNPDETIVLIRKSPYLQYFIGLKEFSSDLPFDALKIAEFGQNVTDETMTEIREFIMQVEPLGTCGKTIPDPDAEIPSFPVKTVIRIEADDNNIAPMITKDGASDSEHAINPLEHTLEMPALVEIPSKAKLGVQLLRNCYYRVTDFLQNCYVRLLEYFVNLGNTIVNLVRNVKQNIGRQLTDSYEPRPEIKAGMATLRKETVKLLFQLQQAFLRFIFQNKSSFKITLYLLALLFAGFLVVLIWLPVPAPRMLVASEVYDTRHKLAATFFSENRRPVKLNEVPAFLRDAVLAVEDHRFYKHQGINPGRIIKAAINDLLHGSLEQGGSTITQQLVKNVYLTNERTISRKFQELLYSLKLEYKLSKDQIFELYLNKIYFGHGAYGVKVAAETYFQKELNQLNQAEMALLAGLPRGPAFYSPYNHPKAARQRLLLTLQRMKECGYITTVQYQKYCQQSLSLPGIKTKNNAAPYFMDLLQTEIARIFPHNPELIYTSGLKIESTLDLGLQKTASKVFHDGLPVIYQPQGGLPQPQGALIALNPKNGEIRALLGGTDYTKSQFNRAVQAKRQPGSAFKPILYTAAFKNGFTLASRIDRTPKTYYIFGQAYCPTDHHSGGGMISLRNALAQSNNVVAVKLMERIGFKPVLNLAEQLGVQSKLRPTLSLALGACEVTPLELATVYATLANGGIRNTPVTIRRILDSQGRVLYQNKTQGVAVVDPAFAFLTTQAMREVLKSGTAAGVGWKLNRPAAGKTGTTNNNRDTWFVGYTPDLLACVFVGCDNYERTLPGMASQVAAPIWANFMIDALQKEPVKDFTVPANIKKVSLCKITGKIANNSCSSCSEYFLKGTEPVEVCSGHHFRTVLDRLFHGKPSKSGKLKFDNPSQSKIIDQDSPKANVKDKENSKEGHRKIRSLFEKIWQKIK
jgi:1A family penicillin-binding protein